MTTLRRATGDVAAKAAPSGAGRATPRFRHADFKVGAEIRRADFEAWIASGPARIATAGDAALADAALSPREVDRVLLTGGTSLVPAVRALFERRFGAGRLAAGGEFVSVAGAGADGTGARRPSRADRSPPRDGEAPHEGDRGGILGGVANPVVDLALAGPLVTGASLRVRRTSCRLPNSRGKTAAPQRRREPAAG